ncbi:MAG: exopolysaccharide biosynthesis protein [Verrucomicrobia bacterium]|nr:exopolysaccharide biosynthesis protein [Verrucomicrobiota bacterium]
MSASLSEPPPETPPVSLPEAAGFPRSLSKSLEDILTYADGRDVTLANIVEVLQGRGFNLLILLITIPFCQPVPLPGLSTPFGLVLLLFGVRIALGKEPRLPRRLLDYRVPHATLAKLVNAALVVARRLERLTKPRLVFFHTWRAFEIASGLAIAINAFLFMLPLPIPFSNGLPALSMLLITLGRMEGDGYAIVLGYIVTILTLAYFALIGWGGTEGLQWLFK